jgi:hypothetical protein
MAARLNRDFGHAVARARRYRLIAGAAGTVPGRTFPRVSCAFFQSAMPADAWNGLDGGTSRNRCCAGGGGFGRGGIEKSRSSCDWSVTGACLPVDGLASRESCGGVDGGAYVPAPPVLPQLKLSM